MMNSFIKPTLTIGLGLMLLLIVSVGHSTMVYGKTNNNGETSFEEFGEEIAFSDPLEPGNRVVGTFNDRLYFWVLKPVAIVYKTFLPTGIRQGIANAFDNIRTPIRFFNNIFQGKPEYAVQELERFVINSSLGIGGFFDIAERHFGISKKDEDFGQTLAFYGVKSGPYLVWPFLGPSTVRDSFGMAVDFFLDPLNYIIPDFIIKAEVKGGEVTNYTSMHIGEYEDLKKSALDPYIAVRDAYIQNRQKKIRE
ncbi:MAG: VacJ family lipoprotein [Thermodesulforhabdaceae bacterium]